MNDALYWLVREDETLPLLASGLLPSQQQDWIGYSLIMRRWYDWLVRSQQFV